MKKIIFPGVGEAMDESFPLSELVDLQRYPLGDEAGFAPVAERCKAQLGESSFVSLPGFLRPGVAEAMTREVLDAIPRAYRREQSFSAYKETPLDQYPADHVRHRKHLSRQFVVATDVLDKSGPTAGAVSQRNPYSAHSTDAD